MESGLEWTAPSCQGLVGWGRVRRNAWKPIVPTHEASFEAPAAVPVLLIGEAKLDGGGLCRPGMGGEGQGLVEPQGVLGGAGVDFRGSLGQCHAFPCGWEEERVSLGSILSEASSEQKTINIPFWVDPGEVLLHSREPGTNHIACHHSQCLGSH